MSETRPAYPVSQAEAERRFGLLDRINAVRATVARVADEPSGAIRAALETVLAWRGDAAEFGALWPDALKAVAETLQILETMAARRENAERERAETAAEHRAAREELARWRAAASGLSRAEVPPRPAPAQGRQAPTPDPLAPVSRPARAPRGKRVELLRSTR